MMGWFDGGFLDGLGSLFGGGGGGGGADLSSFVEPSAATGSVANTAADFAGPASWDPGAVLGTAADVSGGIGGANPSLFGGDVSPQGTPQGMPQTDFAPPSGAQVAPTAAPATIGSVAPSQGAAAPSSNFGFEPGEPGGPGGPNSVSGGGVAANPTAMSQRAPLTMEHSTPWYSKIATGAQNEMNTAMANPIRTGLQAATLGAPLLAAALAPSAKQPGKYTLNPPQTPQVPVAPLPGTTGNTSADIPAATPMSPLLTGTGGFRVRNGGMGFAQGGRA